MDLFGIGAGMKAMSGMYIQSARQTGRTTMMVNSLKPGDRVIFANKRERDRVERIIRERGTPDIKCIVVPLTDTRDILKHGTSQGRTVFDHGWVEEHYHQAINDAAKDIDWLQTELSGYGEAHRY